MKTLYKKASHLRSHTWKDIGGLGGLLLDGVFFAFLLLTSVCVLLVGAVIVVLDYLVSPVVALMSLCRSTNAKNRDQAVLLEDGTLGNRLAMASKSTEDVVYPF